MICFTISYGYFCISMSFDLKVQRDLSIYYIFFFNILSYRKQMRGLNIAFLRSIFGSFANYGLKKLLTKPSVHSEGIVS